MGRATIIARPIVTTARFAAVHPLRRDAVVRASGTADAEEALLRKRGDLPKRFDQPAWRSTPRRH
jgi:hypothetical protein